MIPPTIGVFHDSTSRCERPLTRERVYQWTVEELHRDLLSNTAAVKNFVPDINELVEVLEGLYRVRFSSRKSDAGFRLDKVEGEMTIFCRGIDMMVGQVARLPLDRDARRREERRAIETYVIHEIYHIVQRLVDFEDVQRLKESAGPQMLGQIDLVADVTSPHGVVRVEC